MSPKGRFFGPPLGWVSAAAAVVLTPLIVEAAAPPDHLRDLLATALATFDRAQQLRAQQPERATELFLSAARSMEEIASAGVVNGR